MKTNKLRAYRSVNPVISIGDDKSESSNNDSVEQ